MHNACQQRATRGRIMQAMQCNTAHAARCSIPAISNQQCPALDCCTETARYMHVRTCNCTCMQRKQCPACCVQTGTARTSQGGCRSRYTRGCTPLLLLCDPHAVQHASLGPSDSTLHAHSSCAPHTSPGAPEHVLNCISAHLDLQPSCHRFDRHAIVHTHMHTSLQTGCWQPQQQQQQQVC